MLRHPTRTVIIGATREIQAELRHACWKALRQRTRTIIEDGAALKIQAQLRHRICQALRHSSRTVIADAAATSESTESVQ